MKADLFSDKVPGARGQPIGLRDMAKKKRPRKVVAFDQLMEKVVNSPDVVRPRKPRMQGKTTGLGLLEFCSRLFVWNEVVAQNKKLTNAGLASAILLEFGEQNKSLRKKLYEHGKYGVNYYRSLYNRGRCDNGIKPPYISFRYNEQGIACDYRTGKVPLTPKQKRYYQTKFGLSVAFFKKESASESKPLESLTNFPPPENHGGAE